MPEAGQEQQKPMGRLTQMGSTTPLSDTLEWSDATRLYMSCEETYGIGWKTCGDAVCFAAA